MLLVHKRFKKLPERCEDGKQKAVQLLNGKNKSAACRKN